MLRRQADKEKRYTNGGAETGTFLCGRTRTSKKGKCSKSGKNPDLSGHRSGRRSADVPLGKARTSACGHGVPRRRSAHRSVLSRRAEPSVHRLQFSGAGGGPQRHHADGARFIAFAIGNEFRVSQLKTMGKQAITVGILQAVITTIVSISPSLSCISSIPPSFRCPLPSPSVPSPRLRPRRLRSWSCASIRQTARSQSSCSWSSHR